MCVKELGPAIGRSAWFVYKMRGAGFRMEWSAVDRCYVARPGTARRWLKRTGFRVVRGIGVLTAKNA